MQNYWKNIRENHKYFEMTIGIFYIHYYIIKYKLGWTEIGLARLSRVGPTIRPTDPSFFFGWARPDIAI